MWSLIAPISSLLGGVALLLLGNGLLNTLLTLRGVAEGYSTGMLGLIMSGYFVGFLLGTWLAIPLVRRVGHIRAFAFCASLAAITALLHLLFVDPWVWLGLRVLYGLALVSLYMVIESWLNAQVPNDKRGQVFAVYMAVNLGALAAAQQLLNLAEPTDFLLFVLAAMLISAALMPITLTRQAQPSLPETLHTNLRQLVGVAPLAIAAAALSGLALGAFWGLAPVYAALSGFDAPGVGLMMSGAILGGALLQLPIGRYSDSHDRRLVLFWVVLLAVLVALVMSLLPAGRLLLVAMFLWGGLAFAIYPIAVAQLIDQLHSDEILAGSGSLLMINGIGSACGPLLAGVLMQHLGAQALPLYFAATLGLLAAYTLYRLRHVSDLVSEPAGHFMPMLRTSHTVLELMPDAPEHPQEETPPAAAGPH
ncbi:MAG: MFS transporter [Gammaproteobacteria bacterium]|nr:MFS transporter [Gammaproteobacteria bacterium]MBU1491087.1 MFS transporter [Gammaproteobacteria bacterium]MBU2065850.1 MFS transporter [Gammaproteobacteria bacterium]MBU2141176.1 MFS transporter [Gammaproteobacteria bacterium]MBU2215764.1 MFS transporter [Gammaproteobacteria bacterium]